jgi:glyoxylase-like metal-dependent hydrolase (beta-lactamase superfamily II)
LVTMFTLAPLLTTSADLALLDRAIDRLGGWQRLQSLETVSRSGIEVRTLPEQSGPHRGPWLSNTLDFQEVIDYRRLEVDMKAKLRGAQFETWMANDYRLSIADEMRWRGRPFLATPQETIEELALSPQCLLRLARNRLRVGDSLNFEWLGAKVSLIINPATGYLTGVDLEGPRQGFWEVWGDVKTKIRYWNWQADASGLTYPARVIVERNGIECVRTDVTGFAATFGETLPSSSEDIAIEKAIQKCLVVSTPPVSYREIAPGLGQYAAMFPCEVIVQDRGLVIVDPSNSSAFSELILQDLAKRFPQKPVREVVCTDPFWPHFGGFRPYVKRGIPIYAPKASEDVFRAMALGSSRSGQDSLKTARKRLKFRGINGVQTLGTGAESVIIALLPGPETDRMLVVYMPKNKILFASDTLILMGKDKLYAPQTGRELVEAVDSLGWPVDKVFATHMPVQTWASILSILGYSQKRK